MIADTEGAVLRLALDAHTRAAAQDHDPFVACLVVPLASRRRVAHRDDALESNRRRVEEHIDALGRQHARNIVEEIAQAGHRPALARAGRMGHGDCATDLARLASTMTRFTSAPSSSTTLLRNSPSMNRIKPTIEPYMTAY